MYKVNIVCVGKLKEKFFVEAQEEYMKRIKRFCEFNIIEINENSIKDNASVNMIEKSLDDEYEKIKPNLKGFVWVCNSVGKGYSSEEFSNAMIRNLDDKGVITFVVGSSYGLSKKIKDNFENVSFSKMTFPHHLMRIILMEQIYRGFCIKKNITYHK